MLHELWDDPDDDGRFSFCVTGPHGVEARGRLSPRARLVWTVHAASRFEAMTLYYAHQGWGTFTTNRTEDMQTYTELGWELDGRVTHDGADPATIDEFMILDYDELGGLDDPTARLFWVVP